MRFGQIDSQMAECERHLDIVSARGTPIEYYLTQYLLVRIYAEFQTRITLLFERRCRSSDAHLMNFARWGASESCKKFLIGDLKGLLGRFGDDYKNDFHGRVVNTLAHTAWDNIYNNRIAVAHKAGCVMSLNDLKHHYEKSLEVLEALVKTLKLKARQVKDVN